MSWRFVQPLVSWLEWIGVLTLCVIVSAASTSQAQRVEAFQPQLTDPLREDWRVRAFPELKGKGLNCLSESPDQAMWFGIDGGAIRYDGFRWKTFDATNSGLQSSVIAFAGTKTEFFAATRHAIYAYHNNQFDQIFPSAGDQSWVFEDIATSDGSLWAACIWGAIRINHLQESPAVGSPRHDVALFATDAIASRFRDQSTDVDSIFTVQTPETRDWRTGVGICTYGPVLDGNVVVAIAHDSPAARSGVQIGDRIVALNDEPRRTVYERELEQPSGQELRLKIVRNANSHPIDLTLICEPIRGVYETFRPTRIVEDRSKNVWFATRLGRILSLKHEDDESLQWTHHTRDHNLPFVAVPSITVTSDGVAAVGRNTANSEMLHFDGEDWTATKLPRGIGASIDSRPNGDLLVGTNGAIISVTPSGRIDAQDLREYGIFGNDIIVKRTSGAIWIAGKSSVALRFEPQGERWTTYAGLLYQYTAPNGDDWFISDKLSVVVGRTGDQWQEFTVKEGLMSTPFRVIATSTGEVWASGSHEGQAATARLVGERWDLHLHPQLSWSVDRRAVFEDRDGRLWFGAAVNHAVEEDKRGGVMRFDGREWTHIPPTNRMDFVYGMAQSQDGSIWCAGPSLVKIKPNDQLGSFAALPLEAQDFCDSIANDANGNLWVGTRTRGLVSLSVKPGEGKQSIFDAVVHDESKGVSNNRIKSVLPLSDGTVLIGTPAGFDRFDGTTWARAALPSQLSYHTDYAGVHQGGDNTFWFNRSGLSYVSRDLAQKNPLNLKEYRDRFRACRYRADQTPPDTKIDLGVSEANYGDDVVVTWSGVDYFDATPRDDLVYSWRLDDGPWSVFSSADRWQFKQTAVGVHRLQVLARDADLNVDLTPAETTFRVLPLLRQQTWFQLLLFSIGLLLSLAFVQTARVFRREASLRIANQKLLNAEEDLQRINHDLERRVAQRTQDLQEAIQSLHRSEIQFRSIVEDQTEFIVRFDADANIIFANEAYRRATADANTANSNAELAPHGLTSQNLSRLDRVISKLSAATPTNVETLRFEGADGLNRWERWQGRALFDDENTLLGYQAVGKDITALREAESRLSEKQQQLTHLARVSALGEMVAGISHEINQPLATIANFSSASLMVLEKDSDESERGEADIRLWLERIRDQTNRIYEIIKGLQRFGRPGTNMETFDIGDAIHEALELCDSRTRSFVDQIVFECPPDLPKVHADRIQIEQVLVNLIRNACDAMDSLPLNERVLQIKASCEHEMLKVSVVDSGPGFAQDQLEDMFQTFMTTKSDGMGIGLSISRSIVESHRGQLYAVDYPRGGRLEFTLPTHNAQDIAT